MYSRNGLITNETNQPRIKAQRTPFSSEKVKKRMLQVSQGHGSLHSSRIQDGMINSYRL